VIRRRLATLAIAASMLAAAPGALAADAAAPPATPAPAVSAAAAAPAPAAAPAKPPTPVPAVRRSTATAPTPAGVRHASRHANAGASAFDQPLGQAQTSEAVRIALVLTFLTLIPALAVCMTPFVRIVVVLSMIRHAFGMPETPPNQVLVILALFLTAFAMMPTLTRVNDTALQPFLNGQVSVEQALQQGAEPMREFMLRQVHDSDLKAVYDIAREPLPDSAAQVGLMQLTSAFMLNELRVSFKIGFVVMLPFLLIDLVVSSILLSLGMIMVPPTTLSLPIKVLMFVLIDGWSLVLEGVVGSFR
jgi:flagellar biosynthetic protein FliP